ncbi:sulfotransferase family protein [Jatrophihabitans sp.]|uniref:sulfotransferase-like domain-containing protein n=1 Tax=Jatrophihabitans sp. TaxID=1932789 RepID=UPI0038CD8C73
MTDGVPRILALWSAPRCRSTAFFRMMLERGDFRVVHEPFSNLAEFGEVSVAGTTVSSEPAVLARLRELGNAGAVFFKDTTDESYPAVLADAAFLAEDAVHAFLIRSPRETIASYFRLNPEVRAEQIGFGHQLELFEAVRAATGRPPFVMDAERLLTDPTAVIAAFCAAVGIEFRPAALTWQPGHREEWGPSQRWHEEVSRTSGFGAVRPARTAEALIAGNPRLVAILADQQPFYERLLEHAWRPAGDPADEIAGLCR